MRRPDVPFVLLEDRLTPSAVARLFRDPVDIVRCDEPDQVAGAFDRIEAGLARGLHAAGFLAYELGFAFERSLASRMPHGRSVPLLWMGLFPAPQSLAAGDVDAFFAELGPPPPIGGVRLDHDRAAHVAKARRVLDLIAAGDIYQANLTFQLRFDYPGDPLRLYGALRVRQPVAHGAVVAFEDAALLSVSPELFVRAADGEITGRPMKGTVARVADPVADAEAARALAADPKQRAENLMIVDLLRNDFSRVAEPGSVRVPRLFTIESYPTFHALTSTITGRLRPGVGLHDQLAALFPCGSIVGAPKIRAAEVLAELEHAPRGAYTGAIGAVAPSGEMEFNVAIRTAVIGRDGRGAYGVGGGIVADSDPDAEYDEALLKARVLAGLAEDHGLIETLGWSAARRFRRLRRHLDRLERSATALEFRFNRAALEADLATRARAWTADPHARRVRLVLSREGGWELTDAPATPRDRRPLTLVVASGRLDAGDPFLRHKTTRRDPYDQAFAEAEAAGADEAVLLNRQGEIADASRHSLFVHAGGRLITPRRSAGALPGVLRDALIRRRWASEGAVTLETIAEADAIFVGNSLRGLRRARLVGRSVQGKEAGAARV